MLDKDKEQKNSIAENIEERELLDPKTAISITDMKELRLAKPALLLHSCCGPCSTTVIERLNDKYAITVYFYNPNITDKEEYEKRKAAQIEFIEKYNRRNTAKDKIAFIEGPYEPKVFCNAVKGLEQEPEGGKRCSVCFRLRLEKTAEIASISGYDCFAATLTVSPHKNFDVINKIGMQLGMRYSLSYVGEDFKKHAGYQRSVELSKEYGLYRQRYCGCEFSNPDGEKEKTNK